MCIWEKDLKRKNSGLLCSNAIGPKKTKYSYWKNLEILVHIDYAHSKNAWMTFTTFKNWFFMWVLYMSLCKIWVIYMSPNVTSPDPTNRSKCHSLVEMAL